MKYKKTIIATLIIIAVYLASYLGFRCSKYFVDDWGVAGDSGLNQDIIIIDDSNTIGSIGWVVFWPLEKIEGAARDKLIINCNGLDYEGTQINEWLKAHGRL